MRTQHGKNVYYNITYKNQITGKFVREILKAYLESFFRKVSFSVRKNDKGELLELLEAKQNRDLLENLWNEVPHRPGFTGNPSYYHLDRIHAFN